MMWKESYKIGDPLIDEQHKELFDKTDMLLHLLSGDDAKARKEESIKMVLFLKEYAISHFETEENYMASMNYEFIKEHKKLHAEFIEHIAILEKKMHEADFDLNSFKDFSGFLVAWLTYHVAGADQEFNSGTNILKHKDINYKNYVDYFTDSIKSVLTTMIDPFSAEITFITTTENTDFVRINIGLNGDFKGEVNFSFPKETVRNLVKALTSMEIDVIDDMAFSVLAEIANIVSGNAVSIISSHGKDCHIEPPEIVHSNDVIKFGEGAFLDTNHGKIGVTVNIE